MWRFDGGNGPACTSRPSGTVPRDPRPPPEMPHSENDLRRRGFLARLAGGTLALTGIAAVAPGLAAAADVPASSSDYDDAWTARVRKAKHKEVFDSPEIGDGTALVHPWTYRAGYRTVLNQGGDAVIPVVVLRHGGTALALDDAIWKKYGIGTNRKINDPLTKQPAERNPWARRAPGAEPDATIVALLGPDADVTVEGLVKSGAVVLACDLALRAFSRGFAARGGTAEEIHAELRAGLIPGVIPQPSGIYATTRAQEAGCTFLKST